MIRPRKKTKKKLEVEVADEVVSYNPETGMLYGDITSAYMSSQNYFQNHKK